MEQITGNEPAHPIENKVVIIIQLDITNSGDVMEWCGGHYYSMPPMRAITGITLSNGEVCNYGEWIIQKIDGNFYVITDNFMQSFFRTIK